MNERKKLNGYVLGEMARNHDKAASVFAIQQAYFVLLWGRTDDPVSLAQSMEEALIAKQMNKTFVISMHMVDPIISGHRLGFETEEIDKALAVSSEMIQHSCGHELAIAGIVNAFDVLDRAESPIERRLAVHLLSSFVGRRSDGRHPVEAQAEFEGANGRYRTDFLIQDDLIGWRAIVEADGHDFHERTKEQAQRDKRRDRDLVALGFPVMRFTGSEIWRDPRRCAAEVTNAWRQAYLNSEDAA